ncbi:MAG: hypothetical protein EBV92_13685 [Betaproteobacteria bacterium]|nr:hypothetical protein [Betaproteobacteria bacterium]
MLHQEQLQYGLNLLRLQGASAFEGIRLALEIPQYNSYHDNRPISPVFPGEMQAEMLHPMIRRQAQ